jgi:hypothetical protein
MVRRIRLRKILATLVLTLLIWVWADLALDEQFTVSNLKLSIAKSVNPAFWVTFSGQTSVALDKAVLKGSARKIADVRQRINDGRFSRDFYFDPEHENMTSPGEHPLNTAGFLKKADRIVQLGLTVTSVEPNILTVSVVELQKKTVPVKCFDENQNPLKAASIEPAQVEAYVPPEREGSALEAKVVLNRREIEQARLAVIEKTPYVELAPGQTREAGSSVKITLPKEQARLQEYLITSVRLGVSLSANLQGKYKVELVNPDAVMGTVAIRATLDAKRAYDNVRYHVILEIDDSDKDLSNEGRTELRRDLVYNFPPEFVRRDEIVLNQNPVQARYRLIPLESSGAAAEPAPAEVQPPQN